VAAQAPNRRQPNRRPVDRRRRGLTRDDVVAAALRLVDEHGAPALTMRRLARDLGVAPMTVYWHVGDRAELVDALVAEVLGHVTVRAPDEGTWVERMFSVLAQLRAELLRHPNVVPLIASPGRLTPAVIGTGEGVLALVFELGLDEVETVEVFRTVVWQTLGSLFVESFLRERSFFDDPVATRVALERAVDALGLDDSAGGRRLADELTTLDSDALFRYGCTRLLEGIERHAGSGYASSTITPSGSRTKNKR
jgi:AcrR family transcriptional regulator